MAVRKSRLTQKVVTCIMVISITSFLYEMHKMFSEHILLQDEPKPGYSSKPYMRVSSKVLFTNGSKSDSENVEHVSYTSKLDIDVRETEENKIDYSGTKPECPFKFNATVCNFEINSQPSEKVLREPSGRVIRYIYKFRQGVVIINGVKEYHWKTTSNLIVVYVDNDCKIKQSAIYPNPDTASSTKKEDEEFATFVENLPDGGIMLGVLYGETSMYSKTLSDLGLSRRTISQMVYRRGMLMFQLRKGYVGHSKFVLNPKGGGNNTILRRNFHIGYPFNYNPNGLPYGSVLQRHREILPGGHWKPQDCRSRWKIAIIIPFRQREQHLWTFLENMFRFLQLQNIDFTFFVIEQAGDVLFNRAALMNIGYIEAQKVGKFDCFAFHDVDQIPEDLANLYECSDMPRHLVVTRSVTEFRLRVEYYFGGAIMMSADHIEKINGFPNRIFGWGGEDDEIWARVLHVGMTVLRYPMEIGRYRSLSHGQEKSNPHIQSRRSTDILQSIDRYIERDGLNTLKYDIVTIDKRPLYTHIIVYIPGPSSLAELQPIVNLTTTPHPKPAQVVVDQEDEVETDTYYSNDNVKSDKGSPVGDTDPGSNKAKDKSKGVVPVPIPRAPQRNVPPLVYRPQHNVVVNNENNKRQADDSVLPAKSHPALNQPGDLQVSDTIKQLLHNNPDLLAEFIQRSQNPQLGYIGEDPGTKTILAQLLKQNLLAQQQLLQQQAPQQSIQGYGPLQNMPQQQDLNVFQRNIPVVQDNNVNAGQQAMDLQQNRDTRT